MSWTALYMAGFEVTLHGRFWVITEACQLATSGVAVEKLRRSPITFLRSANIASTFFRSRCALANAGVLASPRLHGGLQEQVHGSLRSGLLLHRLVTCTAQSKSHISHRIRRKR
jgi:hypothetical protein